MKRVALCALPLFVALSWAQQESSVAPTPEGTVDTTIGFPVERVTTPTSADLYCAGFISKPQAHNRFVTGGLESPFTADFGMGDAVYLHGRGYEAGQKYSVVRELKDPDRFEVFPGQFAAIKAAGQPYEEVAVVKVIDTRPRMSVAKIEFGCDTVSPGDLVIPYTEKEKIAFHPAFRFDRYAMAAGQATGRIIFSKDFDTELGTGAKVYINVGSNQSLKVGDFLRVERTAMEVVQNPVDSISFHATSYEMTQKDPAMVNPTFLDRGHGPIIETGEMPRRGVGELVIVGTTPTTATGMVVFSLEPIHVGDTVEIDQQ
ncbi:MAG TPA: hypothetical protein VJO35_16160 [Terriglobales bacterium]|nr:hypothetical protein [Terriglobales bacterium]